MQRIELVNQAASDLECITSAASHYYDYSLAQQNAFNRMRDLLDFIIDEVLVHAHKERAEPKCLELSTATFKYA